MNAFLLIVALTGFFTDGAPSTGVNRDDEPIPENEAAVFDGQGLIFIQEKGAEA